MRSAVFSAISLLLVGCAHTETAADRQIAEMREQISRIQIDSDRFDRRLGELEVNAADGRSGAATAATPTPASGRTTPVRTVQLGASGERLDNEDPNDVTERPEIKVAGRNGGRAEVGKLKSSAADPEAKKAYENALVLVNGKQFDKALDAFAAFLVKWPDHPYAENATYWRGEAYFGKGEYKSASEQFEAVLSRPSGGNKAPDALLKLGISSEKLGAADKANEYYARLRSDFPKSDAARKIPSSTSTSTTKGPR